MKTHTAYFTFETRRHREYINITDRVAAEVATSGVAEGMVLVSAMHITAGVWVSDAENGLLEDIDQWLEHLAPFRADYHHRTGESNGESLQSRRSPGLGLRGPEPGRAQAGRAANVSRRSYSRDRKPRWGPRQLMTANAPSASWSR